MLKSISLSSLSLGFGAALLAMAAIPSLKAQGGGLSDWQTKVTFSGPVDIGETSLAAGTYVFRTLGDESERKLVEIMNSDATHLVALVPAVLAQAAEPPDNTLIELQEGPAGSPERVHEWFYPGERTGWEFPIPTPAPAPVHNTSPRPSD